MKKAPDVAASHGLNLRESILFYQLESLNIDQYKWEMAWCARQFIKNYDMERSKSDFLVIN